jgi:hypothetical protein
LCLRSNCAPTTAQVLAQTPSSVPRNWLRISIWSPPSAALHTLRLVVLSLAHALPPPNMAPVVKVPQPGPARLPKSASVDAWLEAAKECKYLSEFHMKQLCEIVKEYMMEGKLCRQLTISAADLIPWPLTQNQTYNQSLPRSRYVATSTANFTTSLSSFESQEVCQTNLLPKPPSRPQTSSHLQILNLHLLLQIRN